MTRITCVALLIVLAGCQSSKIDPASALEAESLEMQIAADGSVTEIEYHVRPDVVPRAVHAAMGRLYPGARPVAAERESHGGALYWELTCEHEGREVEAMFMPDGTLYNEEIEVAAGTVPTSVREAVGRAWPGSTIDKWEEIRSGARRLVEYHAKLTRDGRKYKVAVSPAGAILLTVRELPAEIEVPVPN